MFSNTQPKDGLRTPIDTADRRTFASGVAVVVALPLLVGVVVGTFLGSSAAFCGVLAAFGIVALVVSVRWVRRAEAMARKGRQTARIESAAAQASRALLKRDVVDPVGTALGALVEGVDADAVFLETNTREAKDEHGNLPSVRDVLHSSHTDADPGHWELTGWRVGPDGQEILGSGEAFSTVVADLDSLTNACYRAAQIGSEILVPITAEGVWVGSIGLTSSEKGRCWTSEEHWLLRSLAGMIGSYWERRDARGKLEELLAAKDEFIASVSHEVRTPLTAVLGFAHELDEGIDKFSPEERADLISLIASQSREVANIVDDLLTAARAEAGTIVIAPRVVSVRDLVGEVLSSHSGRVDFLMEDDIELWADDGRVRQVLRNLLTNAERYGGDIVRINAHHDDGAVVVEVSDNGEGIPRHMRDHVFEPYARANNGTNQPASVGLGLSVARQLAQMMDGDLELSQQDGWTVFTLTLPSVSADNREPLPA